MATKKKQPKKAVTKPKSSPGRAKKAAPKKVVSAKATNRESREAANEMYRMKLILKENRLLRGLSQEEIDYFARHLSLRRILRGNKIFKEGEHGDYLFFVIHGRVEVRLEDSHNHHVLGLYTAGALVGEMSLIDEYPRSATVSAIEDTEILILTRNRFNTILKKNQALGIKLLLGISRVISARLRNTMGRFFELA